MNIIRRTKNVLNLILSGQNIRLPVLLDGVTINISEIHTSIAFTKYCFHTSAWYNKQHRKRRKVQEERDITYISTRKKKPVYNVWKNMTVEDLGRSMGKNANHIFELMTFVDNTEKYTKPDQVIDDWRVLCEIIHKADGRLAIIAPPRKIRTEEKAVDVSRRPPPDKSRLVKRPPVVTVMGHVDHGKTTLLDALRNTSVVSGEFGGITQHIGAFSVKVNKGEITFLDTPGHAAFSSMRSRGAHCTDIVVLVVAADDGVMEQTLESIRMAQEAKVPLIVAINKIDKSDADIERTKKMLLMHNIVIEEYSGDVQCVPISALRKLNLDHLIDAILSLADMCEIKGDPTGPVEGIVIESKLSTHRGSLSTILVQRGTLRKGTVLVAGVAWAKVRNMFDAQQKIINEAPPSTPVETIGWQKIPTPGEIIIEVESEKQAREVIDFREKKLLEKKALQDLPEIQKKIEEHNREYKPALLRKRQSGLLYLRDKTVLDTAKKEEKKNEETRYNILIKGDVEGSIEAILDVLTTYNSPLCKFDVIDFGVGNVTIGDVEIAEVFKSDVYTFNTDVLPAAKQLAAEKSISIHSHNVIYRLVDDIKKQINARLPPRVEEEIIGEAEVLELFLITEGKKKDVPVAGCSCTHGELKANLNYKVIRNGQTIHIGNVNTIRHLKQVVHVIKKGQECGVRLEDTSVLFTSGDIIQCFKYYDVPQEIDWNPF